MGIKLLRGYFFYLFDVFSKLLFFVEIPLPMLAFKYEKPILLEGFMFGDFGRESKEAKKKQRKLSKVLVFHIFASMVNLLGATKSIGFSYLNAIHATWFFIFKR